MPVTHWSERFSWHGEWVHSHHGSDFQFNTFFDIMFYLLAGLVVFAGRYKWIVPITILGALNRETSALIPVLPEPSHSCATARNRSEKPQPPASLRW
jgi:hypothetical protein